MKIAVEGCAHGELEKIYETISGIEQAENIKVDLLLCCGDFQSTRNMEDLQTMAVPKKYQDMCTFYKYYSGELVAPILTIFIGGNHEASNHLQELPYGGWVAPNIYYLGYAGVVRVNGIRIAGLSGIYKGHDYLRGRFEFAPYNDATRTSVYHVRQLEVFRLKQLSGRIDICMSHDWPRGIYNFGNKTQLARFKPHFRDEMDKGQLGSRPCEDLLKLLKPDYWFAAHLHCKFAAVVPHDEGFESDGSNGSGAEDAPNDTAQLTPGKSRQGASVTKFLALDKCLPRRRFLQVVDIETPEYGDDNLRLEYDLEWLTILSLTNHLVNVKSAKYYLPGPQNSASNERYNFTPSKDEQEHVLKKFGAELLIPRNFARTVEPYNPNTTINGGYVQQPKAQINPQSQQFCDALGIDDPVSLAMIIGGHELNYSTVFNESAETEFNDSVSSMMTEDTSLNTSNSTAELHSPQQQLQEKISPYKRKSTTGLCLPKPISALNASPDSSPFGCKERANPDELQLTQSSEEDEMEMQTKATVVVEEHKVAEELPLDVNEAAAADLSKPPIKKFKRRNQSAYMDDSMEEGQT